MATRAALLGVLAWLSAGCRAPHPAGGAGGGPGGEPLPVPSPPPSSGAEVFADATAPSGIVFESLCGGPGKDYILEVNGAGACWLDYDRDGEVDLYLVNGSTLERARAGQPGEPNRLFRGLGGGRFADVTGTSGTGDRGWGFGCSVGDYDNDGWPDLFVGNFGADVLLHNRGDGRFEDVTLASGASDASWSTGSAFFDADGDGLLDLYVAGYVELRLDDLPRAGKVVNGVALACRWADRDVFCGPAGLVPARHRFYRNRGDGTFAEASAESGMAGAQAFGFTVVPFDADDDGDTDLFVANDSVPNYLWENDGHGHFRERGLASGTALDESGHAQASMGVAAGDADGDLRIDLFFTNFAREHPTLLRNLGRGQFQDVSFAAGVAPSLERLGWGTEFVDLDNDGDLDLVVVNGHVYPQVGEGGEGGYHQRSQVFRNRGDGVFEPWPVAAGSPFATPWVGRGAAFADYDRDGGMDALVTRLDDRPILLHNQRPDPSPTAPAGKPGQPGPPSLVASHWLEVTLAGTRSNRDGYGARVELETASGRRLRRDLHSGGSYLSASEPVLHFGLGGEGRVARLSVLWPSGARSEIRDVAVDRRIAVGEETPTR